VLIRSGFGVAIAAMGFLAVGYTSPAFAQAGVCTGNGKISKQIAKPMAAAQDAQKAKKWQDVLTRTREAEGTQVAKTAWDQHWMHEFRGYAYSQLGQYPEATREYEAGLASPCMSEAARVGRYKTLVTLFYAQRNYPKVIDYANRALKSGSDLEWRSRWVRRISSPTTTRTRYASCKESWQRSRGVARLRKSRRCT